MKKRLFLFDGTAMAYRSHYAFIKSPLINSKGKVTSAVYGVISSFLKIYEEYKPEYIAFTFDRKEKTFRHELTSDYKANRPPMPDDLIEQIEALKDFLRLAEINEISQAGFEADDMIGTLAKKFEKELDVVIISGDKDFAQLVNNSVSMYDHKTNSILREDDIYAKFEVKPSQFIDYLSLVGDSSDCIPGAKGIGPKAAIRLLADFNDIETLYEKINEITKAGEKEKLINSRENVFLSKVLASIKTDIEIDITGSEYLAFDVEYLSRTLSFLDEYELRNLKGKVVQLAGDVNNVGNVDNVFPSVNVNNVGNVSDAKDEKVRELDSLLSKQLTLNFDESGNKSIQSQNNLIESHATNKPNFILIEDIEHLKQTFSLCKTNIIAIDTETTSIDFMKAELVGISFCFSENEAYYIPLAHIFADNLDINAVLELMSEFLLEKVVVGHNLKYDLHVLGKYAKFKSLIEMMSQGNSDYTFDTMLAAYLLDPGKNEYSLTACAKRELDYDMTPISELIGKGKKQICFSNVDVEKACNYSADDALITYQLYWIYIKRLQDLKLCELYFEIEIPLLYTLIYMEKLGVNIDVNELKNLDSEISQQINVLISDIHKLAGEEFNINSPLQLSNILFNKLSIKPIKKTQTGFSTDIEVLEILAEKHEIAKLLIEYRHLTKMKNTYIEALPELVDPITHRVHSSFNQTITSTGRLSSTNPNLQNIPIRTELGKKIRKAFTAKSSDKVIVSADYSQIELRIFAMLSKDESMLNAFREGADIHTNTAATIFHKEPEQVDSNERRKAKVINFGIIYGMGSQSLSKELGISQSEGKEFIDNYFTHFPTIKTYIDKQKFEAHQNSYVETIFKRRLYLTELRSGNQRLVSEAERVAINMPIQGTAADIIKIAMNNIYHKIRDRKDIKMLIQVHDELVFEVDKGCLDEAIDLIRYEMVHALPHEYREIVPMVVDVKYGESWYSE